MVKANLNTALDECDVPEDEMILRLPAVMKCTGESQSGIYKGVANGTFPAPFRSKSPRMIFWTGSAIRKHIARRIAEATQAPLATPGLRDHHTDKPKRKRKIKASA